MRCNTSSSLRGLNKSLGNSRLSHVLRKKGCETWERKIRRQVWKIMGDQPHCLKPCSTKSADNWNIWEKHFLPLSASLTFQYYSLRKYWNWEIFKLREVLCRSVGGKVRGKEKGMRWSSEHCRMQSRSQRPGSWMCLCSRVGRFFSTASSSRHMDLTFVPSYWNPFLVFYIENF